MKRILTLAFLSVSLLFSCAQQEQEKKPARELKDTVTKAEPVKKDTVKKVREDKYARHTFWRISSKSTSAYILGSPFFLKKEHYPLDPTIEKAFEEADYFVLEINPNNVDLTKRAELTRYMDGTTIEDHCSPESYLKIKDIATAAGVSLTDIKFFNPAFAITFLCNKELANNGFKAEYWPTYYFLKKVKWQKILEISDFEKEVKLANEMLEKYMDKYLDRLWESINDFSKNFDDISIAWLEGDLETLKSHALPEKYLKKHRRLLNALIFEKNHKITKKIKAYLNSSDKYFILINIDNCLGKGGVIDALEKTGKYKVEQL